MQLDTGFLKQGEHSVEVQRQYTGLAGKTTNCQFVVSLSATTRTDHAPINFALYQLKSWIKDSVLYDFSKPWALTVPQQLPALSTTGKLVARCSWSFWRA